MSDHGAEHGATAVAADSHAAPAPGELRFEKQELESFVADDTHAGRAIGQLLAFLFCVLLTLMVSATIWTAQNQNINDDPFAILYQNQDDGHSGGH